MPKKVATVENTVEVVSTSFASIAKDSDVIFGDNFAKLPLGEFIISFTTNHKVVANKFHDEGKESSSPNNLLVECTITTIGALKSRTILSSGYIRINSSMQKMEIGKSYQCKSTEESFVLNKGKENEETKEFNKLMPGYKELAN